MRTYYDRSGRYRGHSEGCAGLAAHMLGGLILLAWPWALGLGWAAWLVAVPVYAGYAAVWYGGRHPPRAGDHPVRCGLCGHDGPLDEHCDEPRCADVLACLDRRGKPRAAGGSGG